MQIIVKNKNTLLYDDFKFKCCVGKNGVTSFKKEGDKKTPKGTFSLGPIYYRKKRSSGIITKLKLIAIKKNMGWCDDVNSKFYNKLIKTNIKVKHEKLFTKNNNYDILIPIKYNMIKPKRNKGSAIFLHLTNNFKKTLGCIAINKKDMKILLKLINIKTKIKII